MSILNRVEDWIITRTLTPAPIGVPPSDDGMLALIMFAGLLLLTAMTCGHCLAR